MGGVCRLCKIIILESSCLPSWSRRNGFSYPSNAGTWKKMKPFVLEENKLIFMLGNANSCFRFQPGGLFKLQGSLEISCKPDEVDFSFAFMIHNSCTRNSNSPPTSRSAKRGDNMRNLHEYGMSI